MATTRQKKNAAKQPRPSEIRVFQITPKQWGVFLKNDLLKRFNTKAAADAYAKSIRDRAKKNPKRIVDSPSEFLYQRLGEHWYLSNRPIKRYDEVGAKRITQKQYDALEKEFKASPAGKRWAARLAKVRSATAKKNPLNIFGVVAGLSGVQSALQINEMLKKKKPVRRKTRAKVNPSGKTTAKAKNPHGDMPSGARFNEKLFDQDLAAIEDGNFRLIRSAKAHGRLAGYKAPEIDRLVQRARLAFQLKEMYRRKSNPANVIGKIQVALKNNGRFKGWLARRKAASALKRELKLEDALTRARQKKSEAVKKAKAASKTKKEWSVTFYDADGRSREKAIMAYTKTAAVAAAKRGVSGFTLESAVKANPAKVTARKRVVAKRKPSAKRKVTARKPTPPKRPAVARKRNVAKVPRSRTFENFQGRKVTSAKRLAVSEHAPARLAQLGDLIEIKLVGGQILKPNPSRAKLCAANGKLWIAGQKFAKPNPSAKVNEINPLGQIDHVVYRTHKPHHGDPPGQHYIHRLGEVTGHRPTLCVDRAGFPIIRGGQYKIRSEGIVN